MFIDWSAATKAGFWQFDIGKLLTKAGIDESLERRLVEYAAQQLSSEHLEQAQSTYQRNAITQELLSARRYLQRAAQTPEGSLREQFQGMAAVLFNEAVRRLQRENKQNGFCTSDFLEEIVRTEKALRRVDDTTLATLRHQHNPHSAMSQENLQYTPRQNVSSPSQGVEKDLDRISGVIKRQRWLNFGRKVAAGVLVTAVGAAGMIGTASYLKHQQEQRRAQEFAIEREYFETQKYHSLFTDAFARLQRDLLEGTSTGLTFDDSYIGEMAKKYGLDALLLRRIMETNRVYGDIEAYGPGVRRPMVNLLDPIALADAYPVSSVSSKENLEAGAERLARLLKENGGDTEKALKVFYTPSARTTVETKIIFAKIGDLAYNAQNGIGMATDCGLMSRYLRFKKE